MRSTDEPNERLPTSSLTPEPARNTEAARLVQRQIEEEVEQIWEESTIEALCELFDPQQLVSAKIAHMWHHHQLRPEYKDFVYRWAQPDRWERAEVVFWYAYWYQEKRILERIAGHREIMLGGAASDDGKSCMQPSIQVHCSYLPISANSTLRQRTRSRSDRGGSSLR